LHRVSRAGQLRSASSRRRRGRDFARRCLGADESAACIDTDVQCANADSVSTCAGADRHFANEKAADEASQRTFRIQLDVVVVVGLDDQALSAGSRAPNSAAP